MQGVLLALRLTLFAYRRHRNEGIHETFRAYFSIIKLSLLEFSLAALCILPLISGFGVGLHYTSAFYTGELSLVRIGSCVFLGFIFLSLLPLLLRAIAGKPALTITDDEVSICNAGCISLQRSGISAIEGPDWQGNMSIRYLNGQKSISLPVSMYRQRAVASKEIKGLST